MASGAGRQGALPLSAYPPQVVNGRTVLAVEMFFSENFLADRSRTEPDSVRNQDRDRNRARKWY